MGSHVAWFIDQAQSLTETTIVRDLVDFVVAFFFIRWLIRWFKVIRFSWKLFFFSSNLWRWDSTLRSILRIHNRNRRMVKIVLYFIFTDIGRRRLIRLQSSHRRRTHAFQQRYLVLIEALPDQLGADDRSARQRALLALARLDKQQYMLGTISNASQQVGRIQARAARLWRLTTRLYGRTRPSPEQS